MPIRVYTSFDQLPNLARHSFDHPQQQNFFLSLSWFRLLFETSLKQTRTPRVYVAFDGADRPHCELFCSSDRTGSSGMLRSLGNFYTQEFGPSFAASAARREALIGELIEFISNERPRWDGLRLDTLISNTQEFRFLSERLVASGFAIHPFFQYENWFLPTAGEAFEPYFARRPSQLRNTVKRRQKKLEKAHRFEIKVARDESPELPSLIEAFIHIYGLSWKEPEPFPDFIPTLATRCAKLGVLRLGVLFADALPVAAQLWITSGGKALIYKLSYDEQFAELGVGSILSKELFRIALDEDHVEEIDYGVGSEAYKRDWMSEVRKIEGIEAFNRKSAKGLLMSLVMQAKEAAKKMRATVTKS